MQTIVLRGVPHVYELTPPNPSCQTLVFIHGWLLSRHYWRLLIERLSAAYQCLAYDLRGFGNSCLPQVIDEVVPLSSYSLASYAKDLAHMIEQLNLTDVWLVGHSLGGSIAIWGAYQLPEQVKGVICINAGGGIYLKEEFERFRAAGRQIVKLRPRWLSQVPFLELAFMRSGTARSLSRQWARQRLVDFVTAHPDAALGALLESTTETEVHRLPQIVSKLEQPVYFIAGTQDFIMEPQYVRYLASFHWLFGECGDNVFEIPNCGHLAMIEQPEVVAETIQTILASHS
ncbi:putative hydrolase or acyltransferase of alpha/beta superfamily [Leptolyngbyaceae cyanobacterium JSC-12]|nr:putative hydrolase or acyltransferase of alpha/beta superfamily [Leptolyngbyaceae cyanobacterium JSC-12]